MKKTILTIAVATLCLFFKARSQNLAEDVTSKGIQIGQRIPNVKLENIQNYKAKTASIADFEGKLLILDFWATWCSPCLAMRPKMEALQQKFNGKVQFLSLTYEQPEVVLPFLEKLNKGKPAIVPDVMNEQTLHRFFPHIYLPHYVWIDRHGIVKAITGMHEVTAENIEKMLNNPISLPSKKDMKIAYDEQKPFLVNNNGGDGSSLIYHSVLTGYVEGMTSAYKSFPEGHGKGRRIMLSNLPLSYFYSIAYGGDETHFGKNRMSLEVIDKDKFIVDWKGDQLRDWLKDGNGYCYELQVPVSISGDFYNYMKDDLKKLFPQYHASVVRRKTNCLALVRISGQDKLKAKGGAPTAVFNSYGFTLNNCSLTQLIAQLNMMYLQKSPIPIVDHTGYEGLVDMRIEANLSNVSALNSALAKYDLQFVEKELPVEVLVITSPKSKILN